MNDAASSGSLFGAQAACDMTYTPQGVVRVVLVDRSSGDDGDKYVVHSLVLAGQLAVGFQEAMVPEGPWALRKMSPEHVVPKSEVSWAPPSRVEIVVPPTLEHLAQPIRVQLLAALEKTQEPGKPPIDCVVIIGDRAALPTASC